MSVSFQHRLVIVANILLGMLCLACPASNLEEAEQTIVLANDAVDGSVALARHYMKARKIPEKNLCVLSLPTGEIIARTLYTLQLQNPLNEFLRENGFVEQVRRDPDEVQPSELSWKTIKSSVRYIVSMYGVPVQIADSRMAFARRVTKLLGQGDHRDAAAVDAELAGLLLPPAELEGPRSNPLCGRYEKEAGGKSGELVVLAARLDGSSPEAVREMIDASVQVERYGLCGRAYFDKRNVAEQGYNAGDHWLTSAYRRFRDEGYECALEASAALWGKAFPMEDAAVYMGWYARDVRGVFLREGFRFQTGALAYHIHSASAERLRVTDEFWAGPLVHRGAAFTMGAVGEPYLNFTPHIDILADRLCSGLSFGESVYMSLPVLSWQMAIVGDPLCRPFRYSLDAQIRHMEADERVELQWGYLRRINQWVREGRFNFALSYCRSKMEELDSLVLREQLGNLYARNELFGDAGEQYDYIIEHAETVETAVRVGRRWMVILRTLGKARRAEEIAKKIQERWPGNPALSWLETAE